MFSNQLPSRDDLDRALAGADLVVYAYSAHALARDRVPREMQCAIELLTDPQ